MVLNPHTGKYFCKSKCWLKTPDSTGSYPSKQDKIDKNVKEGRELREKQGYSARLGGAMHDAVNIAIARLSKGKAGLDTRDDMESEIDYWFDSVLEKLASREKTIADATEKWSEKKQEIYNSDSQLETINSELEQAEDISINEQ